MAEISLRMGLNYVLERTWVFLGDRDASISMTRFLMGATYDAKRHPLNSVVEV